jgi:hypothetical protein
MKRNTQAGRLRHYPGSGFQPDRMDRRGITSSNGFYRLHELP